MATTLGNAARLAEAVGAHRYTNRFQKDEPSFAFSTDKLQKLIDMAKAEERERCAALCESAEIPFNIEVWMISTKKEMTAKTALALADLIRSDA